MTFPDLTRKFYDKIRTIRNLHVKYYLILFHTSFYLSLLILAFLTFKVKPIETLWFTGSQLGMELTNDSWRYIGNTLNIINPPYPFHLIATSVHFFIPFSILSLFFPSNFALIIAVLLVQYIASLLIVFLLYDFLQRSFNLVWYECFSLAIIYESIFISPFLLLATTEILFVLYQIVAWACFIRQRYFFAAIAASMTFALRFNGAFFCVGFFLICFLKWGKTKEINLKIAIKTSITLLFMFLIGFSSFILNLFTNNDFWLPLTAQIEIYKRFLAEKSTEIFNIPFLWWLNYISRVLESNSLFEFVFLFLGIITFLLAVFSMYKLIRWWQMEKSEDRSILIILSICGFLGINLVTSNVNYARFQSTIFPLFPFFPLLIQDYSFSSLYLKIITIVSVILSLLFNTIWWLSYIV